MLFPLYGGKPSPSESGQLSEAPAAEGVAIATSKLNDGEGEVLRNVSLRR